MKSFKDGFVGTCHVTIEVHTSIGVWTRDATDMHKY